MILQQKINKRIEKTTNRKAQTYPQKKAQRTAQKENHKLGNTVTKIAPQKTQKQSTNCQTYAQKNTNKNHKLSNTDTKNSTSKFWPSSFSRTGLLADSRPEAKFSRSWSQPHSSCVWPLTGPPKFKLSQSTFCNKRRKKKAPARTQECTPSRLTPKRQTLDLASEVKNSSLHPV